MEDLLEAEAQVALHTLLPDVRSQIARSIERLREASMWSFESLLMALQERQVDEALRLTICWLLGQFGDIRAVDTLLAALEDPSPQVIWEAAKSLGVLKSKQAVDPLIASLLKGDNLSQRRAAAYALGILRDKRAIKPLLRVLADSHEDATLRGHSAEALANLQDRRAIPALVIALRDPEIEVRFWSAFALGELGAWSAVPELEHVASVDHEVLPGWWTVSKEAKSAIEKIKRHP